MKIIQINSVCGIGSTGRIATDLHSILSENGHQSIIAYGRDNTLRNQGHIRIGNKFTNFWDVFNTRFFDNHGFSSYLPTINFLRKVDKFDPDIIHLHNLHGYYINVELLFNYLKSSQKKIIWTFHDCWPITGHCTYFEHAGCTKWKTGCFDCPLTQDYPKSFFDNSQLNYISKKKLFQDIKDMHIVTPSRWLSEVVKRSFLKNYPISVINNGIDLKVFKRIENSNFKKKYKLEGKFILLGVALDFTERKGFSYFLKLALMLSQNEKLILVGLTKKQINILPSNIIGISRTNSVDELLEIYSAADVFVNLTLEDNFPTTNLEALACGLPVITFNSGGSAESVNKQTGFVVGRFDLNGVISAFKSIKNADAKKYALACRQSAEMRFSKDDKFSEYIDLYKLLLN